MRRYYFSKRVSTYKKKVNRDEINIVKEEPKDRKE